MCVLILGLMTAWAGTAQAEETGGKWTYETGGVLKTFEGVLHEPSVGGALEPGTEAVLHAKVLGGTELLYDCTALSVVGGKLQLGGHIRGSLVFSGCRTLLNGVTSNNCKPKAGGTEEGVIKTVPILVLMLLHKLTEGVKDKVLIAHPVEGTNFAFVESTAACSLGIKVPIGGLLAFQDPAPTEHLVNHLIKEFLPLNDLYVISKTAEHKAHCLSSAILFLTGEHLNYKWAGLWN
jgi:hypothetical protein